MKGKYITPLEKARKIVKNELNFDIDPRILAHNIKHNIDDFSEEKILAVILKYAEQTHKL